MQPALQTAPNSGIPPKKRGDDDAPAPKGAAGVLFVAPDGHVLLLRRSFAEKNFGGHWALPGGGMEEGETAEDAADRETREEIGYDEEGEKKLINQKTTPTGMTFHTFERQVPQKFAPRLNDEHSGYVWTPTDALPEPVHPAVKEMLQQRGSSDSRGAASDALAMDRDSVRTKDADGRLHIAIANISKATVNPYKGSEIPGFEALGLDPGTIYYLLRDPEEMRKAAPTFNGVPLLMKHEATSADEHPREITIGAVGGDASFEFPYLRNSLVVWDGEGIDGIEDESQRELSCSYRYRPEMTPGVFDGMRYDGVMRDIVGNHVALVEDGRAGSDVLVGDSNEEIAKMAETTLNRKLAQTILAVAARTVSLQALSTYLRPRLAKDAKIDLGLAFDGITGAKFKESKPKIAKNIREQSKGKLAKDASLDDVEKVLDMLDGHEVDAGDESVSKEQHNAMAAAAEGNSNLDIPEKVGKEFVDKDKGKTFDASEKMSEWLKGKGMGEDDIAEGLAMMQPPAASDEESAKPDSEEENKRLLKGEDENKEDKEDKKDMVDKKAMDQAIEASSKATAERVRKEVMATQRHVQTARETVRPWVGELAPSLAFDSAADVFRHALTMMGVDKAKDLHADALEPILRAQPKPGAKPSLDMAYDTKTVSDFSKRFEGGARIQV